VTGMSGYDMPLLYTKLHLTALQGSHHSNSCSGELGNLPGCFQREPSSEFYACENYVQSLKSGLQSSYTLVRRNLESSQLKLKKCYENTVHVPQFKLGDFVLMKDLSVSRGRSRKLEAAYIRL
jgi:hypothetical protein